MKNSFLSIITVNLNNADGLQKTIDSVIKNAKSNAEFVIIDGGSLDQSVEVIKSHESQVKYWISEPDKGIYHAMNKGILNATGDYCLFLNSADWLDEGVLKDFEQFVKNNPYDIITGDITIVRDEIIRKIIIPEKITAKQLIIDYLPHQSTFIKRSLFNELGLYNENNRISSDREFFIKAILHHDKSWCHFNRNVAFFDGSGISSTRHTEVDAENWKIAHEQLPLFAPDYQELYKKSKELEYLKKMNNKPLFKYFKKIDNSKLLSFYRNIKRKLLKP